MPDKGRLDMCVNQENIYFLIPFSEDFRRDKRTPEA